MNLRFLKIKGHYQKYRTVRKYENKESDLINWFLLNTKLMKKMYRYLKVNKE